MAELFVGIDLGNYEHFVCVLSRDREVLAEFVVKANGEGEAELLKRLRGYQPDSLAAVEAATEVTSGPIVEALLDAGVRVYGVNPKQVDRFRDRHSVAGSKDDRRDAFVIADALSTDRRCFRELRTSEPEIVELRGLSRESEELKKDLARTCGRLRTELLRYYPQVLELSPGVDDRWVWSILELAPTPAEARRKGVGKIAEILKSSRVRRFTADEVRALLKSRPVTVAPGVTKAASERVLRLVQRARFLAAQLREVERGMDRLLKELGLGNEDPDEGNQRKQRDAKTLLSLPGAGRAVVATLLTEATGAIHGRDYQALRALTGVAPVKNVTGRRKQGKGAILMRRACSPRLRQALYHWARVAIQRDEAAREQYDRLRAKGHGHARVLRSVGDRLLRIACAMLQTGTLYDPRLRGATRAATAA